MMAAAREKKWEVVVETTFLEEPFETEWDRLSRSRQSRIPLVQRYGAAWRRDRLGGTETKLSELRLRPRPTKTVLAVANSARVLERVASRRRLALYSTHSGVIISGE